MAQEAEFGLTSDFSAVAQRYDATRDLPKACLLTCVDRLIERGLFPPTGTILDAGCGTGQVSLPLAERGYAVRGIDISAAMIRLAQAKVQPGWRASYVVGDVRGLADADSSVDAVVVSKLFQHIQDWQKACGELVRVVRPGGTIVQINEKGAFGNAVRRYFSDRASERGFTTRFLGINPRSDVEITRFMATQACRFASVDMSDVRWDVAITYGEAIGRIRDRLFAEFWYLPIDVHDDLVAETAAWIETQPDGPETIEHLRPTLIVEAFRTPER